MRDTSKVDRTAVVDGFQELSKREMEDVMGGYVIYGWYWDARGVFKMDRSPDCDYGGLRR